MWKTIHTQRTAHISRRTQFVSRAPRAKSQVCQEGLKTELRAVRQLDEKILCLYLPVQTATISLIAWQCIPVLAAHMFVLASIPGTF